MPSHQIALPALSRRALFRQSALLGGAAALTSLPFGRQLLAHDVSENWPTVAAMANRYVSERKLANLLLTFGWGQEDHAHTVGGGNLSLAKPGAVDENSLYRIYSMSKPITGMAIMMLIDDGKLGLDMPLHEILPEGGVRRMQSGLRLFDSKIRGYAGKEALLLGFETRTSSPVRIPRRDDTLEHPELRGLYPCGEGAVFVRSGAKQLLLDHFGKALDRIHGRLQFM